MKKFKKPLIAVLSTTVAAASLLAFAACDPVLTDEPLNATKIADYTKTAEDRAETFASGSKGWSWENGGSFNVWWNPQNVSYEGGKLSLSISEMTEKEQVFDEEKGENVDCLAEYYGAEERSEHYYGYGDFQVRMKPAKVSGTASTFFTCTGPYDKWYDEDGETVIKENKHDEIDIEFLGKDTTKVQFNYFANGVGGHEYMYDLGFDASVEFHDYGYRWTDSYITWFVDSKPVYRVDRKKNEAWPETPGRIIMNYWCGTERAAAWMGAFNDDYSGKAEYEYVATSATQCPDPNTAHVKEEPPVDIDVPETGWTDIDYSGFGGWSGYTVDTTDGLTISHSEAKSNYACEGMSLADSYSWVKFKIKNNDATNAADLRIDVKKEGGKGGVEAVSPANEKVSVNTAEAAVMIKLDAGEEQEIAVKIKDVLVDQFVVFLNSMSSDSATVGSVTITELKGIVNGDVTPPEPEEDHIVKIGDNEVEFSGGYDITCAEDKSSMTLEYTDLAGNSYSNVNASVESFVADNNVFTVTIKNEGTETATVRIDVNCPEKAVYDTENGTYCNLKAEYTGTIVASGNNYAYGGADWVKIAAGETITAKITFKTGVGANGLSFFVDSSTWDDATSHTGKVVFSDMAFSKEEVVEVQPTLPEGEGWTAIELPASMQENNTDGKYTHETAANSIHITHSEKPTESSSLSTSVAYGENNKVHMKIKNNLDAAYAIRVNVQVSGVWNTTILSAEIVEGGSDENTVDTNGDGWNGITVNLGANAEIVLEFVVGSGACNLCFGLNNMADGAESGDVTISEICMKSQQAVVTEPEPVAGTTLPEGEGWIGLDLTAMSLSIADTYTTVKGNADDNSLNTIQITHSAQMTQGAYPNVNMNVNYGTQNKLYMVIANNSEAAAVVKICVQNMTNYANTMTSATVTRNGTPESITGIEWGASFTLAAGETVVFECVFDPSAGKTLAIVLNENPDGNAAESGDITVSQVAICKVTSAD